MSNDNKSSDGCTYHKIGKVAKASGIDAQTIRAWANQGKLDCKRATSGHRLFPFTPTLEKIKQIEEQRAKHYAANEERQVEEREFSPETTELRGRLTLKQQHDHLDKVTLRLEKQLDLMHMPAMLAEREEEIRTLKERLQAYQGVGSVAELHTKNLSLRLEVDSWRSRFHAEQVKTSTLEDSCRSLKGRLQPAIEMLTHGNPQDTGQEGE